MFEYILLRCINNLKGERSLAGIYNLLAGKRSSQTLQDAHAYQLTGFFAIYKTLDRTELISFVEGLRQSHKITIKNDRPEITSYGHEELKRLEQKWEPLYFAGIHIQEHISVFEERLFLYIQTITNMKAGHQSFLPVSERPDILNWVKSNYKRNKTNLESHTIDMYKELHTLLNAAPQEEAEVFSYRITGAGRIGLSKQQLADKFDLSVHDVHLLLQHSLHRFYQMAEAKPEQWPTLALFVKTVDDTGGLITNSAQKTYKLIKQGLDLESIVRIRGLKMSTIHDHVVEMALVMPDFPMYYFISDKEVTEINNTLQTLNTNKLREIYDALQGNFDYFQIRLVQANRQHSQSGETL
ncbi:MULTISPECIES: helix-turn-helix domain-containing protein [Thalassobacillus]|uniref:helix-turn-helix domain-containing protein n=1 Tax=Thalassobacillus TaxID=331971 RepID=UPI000A1CCCB6|nr:helix-turn-helix domain-containing protein [Thalassobacillus devorans]